MSITNIEWTDRVWNPVTGCMKVSPGCKHCYAEGVAARFWHKQYPAVEIEDGGPQGTHSRSRRFTDVMTHEERLFEPLRWKKPQKVFVNSMSDLFHEDVPDAFIDQVFAVMVLASQHTFQVLTKRPARMLTYCADSSLPARIDDAVLQVLGSPTAQLLTDGRPCLVQPHGIEGWPLPHVWLGVSVEDQQRADERIPLLLQTPAAVRFVSAEPLLGPVDLDPQWLRRSPSTAAQNGQTAHLPLSHWANWGTTALDLVIVGGESGRGARPCDVEWVRTVVSQCRAAGVAAFVKQLGAYPTGWWSNSCGPRIGKLVDRKGADMAEWPADLRVRQMPGGRR